MSAKTSVPRHYAELRNTLHVGKNFSMSASSRVADTSYRSMQASVQYILYLSKIRLYVHTYLAMKKGTFSFNQCTYICTCMYCLLLMCCEAVLLYYIVNVYFQCLQCYTLPVITFCLSLLNAIAGYFVFR